jgi:ketosteroid isomerase-like protein
MPGMCFVIHEIVETEDAVMSRCSLRGTGAASGAEVGVDIAFVARFRDGRIVRMEEYLNAGEARAAL